MSATLSRIKAGAFPLSGSFVVGGGFVLRLLRYLEDHGT